MYIILFFTFAFTNNSCEKEENSNPEIPEWSKVTALKNGEIWQTSSVAIVDNNRKDRVIIQANVLNSSGYWRESLKLRNVPIKEGLFAVYRRNYTDDKEISATYTTFSDDGDVVEDRFIVLESQNNFIEIENVDLSSMEMNGNLQITIVRDSLDPIDNPSLADTIFFADGVFRLKIIE